MIYKHQLLTLLLLTSTVLPVHARQVEQNSDATSVGTPPTPSYKVLYSFTGGSDGGGPGQGGNDSTLVRDWRGNLYGVAFSGGLINSNCPSGCGVVFKVDSTGKETVLHAFGGPPDGGNPAAALTMDEEGNLYGTTVSGGTASLAAGTVFKIDRDGKYSVLYSFGGPDGNAPYASLTRDIWGNLYGTTEAGGELCVPYGGCGVVFKLDRNGKETVLHSFSGADGLYPVANLILDDRGNLFGTTDYGGNSNSGVIFKLDPRGNESVLHSFTGGADGGYPSDLIRDVEGNLYGTAATGGYTGTGLCLFNRGCGGVFKLDRAGNYSSLYAFQGDAGGGNDGWKPYGRLLLNDGDLYGTTFFGGSGGGGFGGTIFKLDRNGKEAVLYNFSGGSDGGNPSAGLIPGEQDALYGTAAYGGLNDCEGSGCGVVFELQTGLRSDGESAAGGISLPSVAKP